jgi:hypothetical protein
MKVPVGSGWNASSSMSGAPIQDSDSATSRTNHFFAEGDASASKMIGRDLRSGGGTATSLRVQIPLLQAHRVDYEAADLLAVSQANIIVDGEMEPRPQARVFCLLRAPTQIVSVTWKKVTKDRRCDLRSSHGQTCNSGRAESSLTIREGDEPGTSAGAFRHSTSSPSTCP